MTRSELTTLSRPSPRYEQALARIDASNLQDPRREREGDEEQPKEWLYSRRMSAWLARLRPDASEELRLAVRAQHLCRWQLPRGKYSADRKGYLAWRTACALMHADLAAEILTEVGYPSAQVQRVADLIQKKQRRVDEEAQCLEDAACLVFLEHNVAEFARQHAPEKVESVLEKTWRKMSPQAKAVAAEMGWGR